MMAVGLASKNGALVSTIAQTSGTTFYKKLNGINVYLLDRWPANNSYSIRRLRAAQNECIKVVRPNVGGTATVNFDDNDELSLFSTLTNTSSTSATNLGEFGGFPGFSNPDGLTQTAWIRVSEVFNQTSGGTDAVSIGYAHPGGYQHGAICKSGDVDIIRASNGKPAWNMDTYTTSGAGIIVYDLSIGTSSLPFMSGIAVYQNLSLIDRVVAYSGSDSIGSYAINGPEINASYLQFLSPTGIGGLPLDKSMSVVGHRPIGPKGSLPVVYVNSDAPISVPAWPSSSIKFFSNGLTKTLSQQDFYAQELVGYDDSLVAGVYGAEITRYVTSYYNSP